MIETQPNRVIYGKTLVELGERNPAVVVLEADISKSTNTFHFARRFPERFFNMGTAEQNLVCFAAGLATTGKLPFVSTFAVFASLRAGEQIRSSVAYPKLNVKIVATNAGVEICGDGPTHQACEDLAVMRAMPNLVVLSPSDPVTTSKATEAIAAYVGPVYMRLGRQDARALHAEDVPFEIGRMLPLREGSDITLIATGNMVEQALLAAEALALTGVQARVLDCHTIKPIDREAIRAAARETAGIVTAEDHSVCGGLGSAVCEVVAETHPCPVRRVGLQDRFASSGRDYRALLAHYGLDYHAILRQAQTLLGLSEVLDSPLSASERGGGGVR
jgi:transketolase